MVKVFWALQDTLAFQRHFPAIDWLTSYSLYLDKIEPFWAEHVDPAYRGRRNRAMQILQRESELAEIVRLVGLEALSVEEQALMDCAKMLREDFLQQNAFRDDDQFSSLAQQNKLLQLILHFFDTAQKSLGRGVKMSSIYGAPVREQIVRAKYQGSEDLAQYDELMNTIDAQLAVVEGSEGAPTKCAWEGGVA